MINSSGRPLYIAVADDLRHRIRSGEFTPQRPLPSEKHLREHYQAGQHTIRSALRVLIADGLIVKQAGALTRVRDTPPMSIAHYPPGHHVGARPATDDERHEFDLPPGNWVLVVVEAETGLEVECFPADRYRLEQGPPQG